MDPTVCPDRDMLADYVLGKTSEADMAGVASHVEACPKCQSQMETLDGLSDTVITFLRRSIPKEVDSDEPLLQEVLSRIGSITSASGLDSDDHGQEVAIPLQVGQYRLMEKLGQGGMGTVYKAFHTKLKRVVAVKLLPSYRKRSPQAIARFSWEMEAVGRLDHPNIVGAHDAGEADGQVFLVMEYVEGVTLSSLTRRLGSLTLADSCDIVRQAAIGLQHIHEHGLVHRDVKPSNLMLTTSGVVKVLDLGLARLETETCNDIAATVSGQLMGTADYMAPEQGSNPRDADAKADVYSLGCTLYFFLAGRPPFGDRRHDTFLQKVLRHIHEQVVPIEQIRTDVPGSLTAILNKMLAKNPADRCATAAEVSELLIPFSSGANLTRLLTDGPTVPQKALTRPEVAYSETSFEMSVSAEFVPHVPLTNRQRAETDPFSSIIEEKTRQFVGRRREIEEVRQWMERNECGFCLIRGNPGVGKSALMSALSQIASATLENTVDDVRFGALPHSHTWPKVAVVPYFIVRGEVTANPATFLPTLLNNIGRVCDLPCVTVGTADELASELHRQLRPASKILRERRRRLLILIDGLDESVSAEGETSVGTSLLSYIPRELSPGVFFVLAGRRRREVDVLGSEIQKLYEMELQGLSEDEVRDLLRLTIGQVDLDPKYVEQVARRSEGNPLYIKFLLQALREGRMRLNDIRSLPKNVQNLLEENLQPTTRQRPRREAQRPNGLCAGA